MWESGKTSMEGWLPAMSCCHFSMSGQEEDEAALFTEEAKSGPTGIRWDSWGKPIPQATPSKSQSPELQVRQERSF